MMDIKSWLVDKIAEETGQDKSSISFDQEFDQFNIDSLSLVSLSYDLEKELDQSISPTLFTEYNTINKLVVWFQDQQ